MRVLISAGETSGDMHAASVMHAASAYGEAVDWWGIAGPAMRAEGCLPVATMEALNVMGVGDVLRAMPRIRHIERTLLARCEEHRPDVALLVDFPGFHMRLGCKLRAMGIPVLQYIAPKLWAWGAWRAGKLAQAQDALASILPFEETWFKARGIDARYVGNPSVIACRVGWSPDALRARLGVAPDTPLLALLPGSRAGELRRHVPILAEVAQRLRSTNKELHIVVPVAQGVAPKTLEPMLGARTHLLPRDDAEFSLRGVSAAVAVSGTATLELALWNVPTILVYRAPWLMALMARGVVRVPWVGLVNILLQRSVMPELLQRDCCPERIVAEVARVLRHPQAQYDAFAELRALLGVRDPAPAVLRQLTLLAHKSA
ncbi:MAG: lipid-A-disaccharide synthase [Zetaproteobacteria bacterium]|nr:MAG: lipid-A-disaccharide synthase [Zetaproteobacteria bacterium]